jgi:anti-sigma regulatory factor (Ser/Thr protein kinase)
MARRFVRQTLSGWGCDELVLSTELVVSELVSNSILHARSALLLRLRQVDSAILVEVADGSSIAPIRRHYAADATTGRGLGLVTVMTNGDWGSHVNEDGKVVWARVPVGEPNDQLFDIGFDDLALDEVDRDVAEGDSTGVQALAA